MSSSISRVANLEPHLHYLAPKWTVEGPADLLPHLIHLDLSEDEARVFSSCLAQLRIISSHLPSLLTNCEAAIRIRPQIAALHALRSYYLVLMEDLITGFEALQEVQRLIGKGSDALIDDSLSALQKFVLRESMVDTDPDSFAASEGAYIFAAYQPIGPLHSYTFTEPSLDSEAVSLRSRWDQICLQKPDARDQYLRYMHVQTNLFEGVITVGNESISNLTRIGFFSNAIQHRAEPNEIIEHGEVSNSTTVVAILSGCESLLKKVVGISNDPASLSSATLNSLHALCMQHSRFSSITHVDHEDNTSRIVWVARRVGVTRGAPSWTTLVEDDDAMILFAPTSEVEAELQKSLSLIISLLSLPIGTYCPWKLSAYIHHALISVHPYSDGNGRLTRYLASLPLVREDLPPVLITPQLRGKYFDALNMARSKSDLAPLVRILQRGAQVGMDYIQTLPPLASSDDHYKGSVLGGITKRRLFGGPARRIAGRTSL